MRHCQRHSAGLRGAADTVSRTMPMPSHASNGIDGAPRAQSAEDGARTHDDIIEEDEEGNEEVEDEFPVPPSPSSVRAYPYPYAIRVPQV